MHHDDGLQTLFRHGRYPERLRTPPPHAQPTDLPHHVCLHDGFAAIVSGLHRHLDRAGIVADQPDFGPAPGHPARTHIDAACAHEPDIRRVARLIGRLAHQTINLGGLQALNFLATIDHHLGRVGLAQLEAGDIGLLSLGVLGPREGVGPAEIVPVVDRERQRHDPGAIGEPAQVGVRLATRRTALGGEQFDKNRRLGRRADRQGEDDQAEQRGHPHGLDLSGVRGAVNHKKA